MSLEKLLQLAFYCLNQVSSGFAFKFIFPAALILAATFCWIDNHYRVLLAMMILLACSQGYESYKNDIDTYSDWVKIDANNQTLIVTISEHVNMNCAVFFSNLKVRGYANLLVHRGIYEFKSDQESLPLMEERNGCAAVYLDGTTAFPDLPQYTKIIITQTPESKIFIGK